MPVPTEFETVADKAEVTTLDADSKLYALVGGADRWISEANFFRQHTGNFSLKEFDSLADAVSEIGSSQVTLEVQAITTVSASLAIPSNITLLFVGEGKISVASGQTLTLSTGNAGWPLRQIFTGSGSVRFGGYIHLSYPQWFGAAMDGTTDDSAALQKAVDALTGTGNTFRGGVVKLIGPCAIGSTILSTLSGVLIEGTGWGAHADTRNRGYLRWVGTTAIPMLKFQDCVRAGVRNLRIIGKSSGTKPSAAVNFHQTVGGATVDQAVLENIWIGSYYLSDTDTGVQFTTGVLFTGAVNGDTNTFKNVSIQQCVTGVDVQNGNASVTHWDTLQIGQCTTGFKTVAPQHIITNLACYLNAVDIELAAQGVDLTINNYFCEGSGRAAIGTAVGPMRLVINGAGFGVIPISSGGLFDGADRTGKRWLFDFKGNNSIGLWLEIRNWTLTQLLGNTLTPVIYAGNQNDAGAQQGATNLVLILEGVKGITSDNFDVGTDNSPASSRVVVFNRHAGNTAIASQFTRYIFDSAESEDQAYQDLRSDMLGKATLFGGPLKVKRLAAPTGLVVLPTGGTGTTYGYRVSALTRDGETLAASTATVSGGAVLSGSVYNTVSFYPVVGAYAYNIYGRTSGSELLLKTLTLAEWGDTFAAAWRDTGALTPSGALPSVNSSGNASIAGSLFLGPFTTTERDALPNVTNGQVIYNSTLGKFQGRAAGAWVDFH